MLTVSTVWAARTSAESFFGRGRLDLGAGWPAWAVAILVVGFGAGVAAVAGYLVTGVDAWIWSAAPAALGSGFALLAVGRAASSRAR